MRSFQKFKAGDLFGFTGHSPLGAFINLATYGTPFWGISHVGILANVDKRLLLFESTTLDNLPCVISGKRFNGTQAHTITDVLKSYDGKVWHYPLSRCLYKHESDRLSGYLLGSLHVPYDEIGAVRSAGILMSFVESCLRPESLRTIFCSEWVASAYRVIGLHITNNVSRWSPNRLCRDLLRDGILFEPRRLK
jgi:hypothetical protein